MSQKNWSLGFLPLVFTVPCEHCRGHLNIVGGSYNTVAKSYQNSFTFLIRKIALLSNNIRIFWLIKHKFQKLQLKLKKLHLPEPWFDSELYCKSFKKFFFAFLTLGFWPMAQKWNSNFFLGHPFNAEHVSILIRHCNIKYELYQNLGPLRSMWMALETKTMGGRNPRET